MGSDLFLFELLSGHEPEIRKYLEIKDAIFRFMGSNFIGLRPLCDVNNLEPEPVA